MICNERKKHFKCDYCGCRYNTETVKLTISGTVDVVTKGDTELERLLRNIQQQVSLGEIVTAMKTGEELTREFPSDYRSWWEYTKVLLINAERVVAGMQTSASGYINTYTLNSSYLKAFINALSFADENNRRTMTAECAKSWTRILTPVFSGSVAMTLSFITRNISDWSVEEQTLYNICPAYADFINIGYANANALSNAGIGLEFYNDYEGSEIRSVRRWARLSSSGHGSVVLPLCFAHGATVVTVGDKPRQLDDTKLPTLKFARVDQSAISTIINEIDKYDEEKRIRQKAAENEKKERDADQARRGLCPKCSRVGFLNSSRTKCRNCGWKKDR